MKLKIIEDKVKKIRSEAGLGQQLKWILKWVKNSKYQIFNHNFLLVF